MYARMRFGGAILAVAGLAGLSTTEHASAIDAQLARICKALTTKQFPPREPGNPAAGSTKGSGRDQQAYFNKCVANNGKVDDSSK